MIRCKQCGDLKVPEKFRKYYGTGRKSSYKTCLDCEKINTRYKYLVSKIRKNSSPDLWLDSETISKILRPEEIEDLNKIEELYEVLKSKGLKPPAFDSGRKGKADLRIDATLDRHKAEVEKVTTVAKAADISIPSNTPLELIDWLTKDLSKYTPEHLQEDISDELQKKFRPKIGVDSVNLVPIYDDRYREVLNEIQERFDVYEEGYYAK